MDFLRKIANIIHRSKVLSCQFAARLAFRLVLALILVGALLPGKPAQVVQAVENPRIIRTTKSMLSQHWRLKRWASQELQCDFHIEAKGLPSLQAVKDSCADATYQEWTSTPPCDEASQGAGSSCPGLYLVYIGLDQGDVIQTIEIPLPSVQVKQLNCQPWTWCDERPLLRFEGTEPMQGQSIKTVHVRLGDQERMCNSSFCELRMPLTDDRGVRLEYWADSTLGDQSSHLILPIRNLPPTQQPEKYLLEVLEKTWVDKATPGAVRWGHFSSATDPLGRLLNQPTSPAELATANKYLLLSGSLIRKGQVDVKECPSGGLELNGSANPCGEDHAKQQATAWQNKYDQQILTAGKQFGVPARLLKALIAQETQFWPKSDTPYEIGLGRLTENGADLLLNWDLAYFLNACTNMFKTGPCAGGFSSLSNERKTLLRGSALTAVGTDQEILLIAATLQASSLQISQMIKNVTQQDAGKVSTLEDLWSLTIANYHIGSGCIGNAITEQANVTINISWADVASHLTEGCQTGKAYVESVISLAK